MADKHVTQLAHDTLNGSFVDIDIRSAKIAHRLVKSVPYRIADKPGVPAGVHMGAQHGTT